MHKILYLLLFPVMVYGQTAQEIIRHKLTFATEQFQTTNESEFVIATPYIKTYAGIAGSPFWATDIWNSAEIQYKGKMYPVSELKYDCANDVMVIPKYTKEGVLLLNLIPSIYPEIFINMKYTGNLRGKMASEIPMKREHFIFYSTSKDEKSEGVSTGYYHYLIEKQVSLLCKYSSSIVDRNSQRTFEEELKFYLQKDGKLSEIRRTGNLLEAFPQWKDKINTFVEANNINTVLSLNAENIDKLIEFINTLSTQ
jgi:hypothetical protein